MSSPAPDWPTRLLARLEWLAGRRALLLCLLLAANGLTRPYAGLVHDSRLYAIQVTERVAPGTRAQDLYLLHGSQDRYTLFTPLLAPLVRFAGLGAAFQLAYLATKAIFFWALLRFVLALVEDRGVAVLALCYLSVAVLPFGGNAIFHLNEPFLTPRLPACALVLLALERVLAGRRRAVVPLLAGALLLHPLMAFAGVLVVVLGWLAARLTTRQGAALALAGALLGAVVVGFEPCGRRVFGHMDSEWRDVNLKVCYFIRPSSWAPGDWLRTGFSTLVVGAAAWTFARRRAAFLFAVLVTAGLGLLASLVAVHSNYLLLIQTSPYRTLWLLELLAVPLGFWGAARCWEGNHPLARCAAPGLPLLLTADWLADPFPPILLFLALLPPWAAFYRHRGTRPRRPDWLAASARASFLSCAGLLCAYAAGDLGLLLSRGPTFYWDMHPVGALISAGWSLFKLPLLLLVLGVAAGLRRAGALRWQAAGLLAFWLGYQGLLTWASAWPAYTDRFSAWQPHGRFVADYLRRQAEGRATPLTVYWTAELQEVWFRAGVNSYYNWRQLSGCAFNRGTAVEGRRRAVLVRAFEMEYFGRTGHFGWWMAAYQRFYELPAEAKPAEEDLFRLCDEEGLDYVVLEHRFPGLYSASDGCFYVYDCGRFRGLAHRPRRPPAGPGGGVGRARTTGATILAGPSPPTVATLSGAQGGREKSR